jgi:hypothetical protein
MKCFERRSRGSLKSEAQISPRKLRFEWSLRERDLELKGVSQNVCRFKISGLPSKGGVGGAFIAPKGNMAVGVSET